MTSRPSSPADSSSPSGSSPPSTSRQPASTPSHGSRRAGSDVSSEEAGIRRIVHTLTHHGSALRRSRPASPPPDPASTPTSAASPSATSPPHLTSSTALTESPTSGAAAAAAQQQQQTGSLPPSPIPLTSSATASSSAPLPSTSPSTAPTTLLQSGAESSFSLQHWSRLPAFASSTSPPLSLPSLQQAAPDPRLTAGGDAASATAPGPSGARRNVEGESRGGGRRGGGGRRRGGGGGDRSTTGRAGASRTAATGPTSNPPPTPAEAFQSPSTHLPFTSSALPPSSPLSFFTYPPQTASSSSPSTSSTTPATASTPAPQHAPPAAQQPSSSRSSSFHTASSPTPPGSPPPVDEQQRRGGAFVMEVIQGGEEGEPLLRGGERRWVWFERIRTGEGWRWRREWVGRWRGSLGEVLSVYSNGWSFLSAGYFALHLYLLYFTALLIRSGFEIAVGGWLGWAGRKSSRVWGEAGELPEGKMADGKEVWTGAPLLPTIVHLLLLLLPAAFTLALLSRKRDVGVPAHAQVSFSELIFALVYAVLAVALACRGSTVSLVFLALTTFTLLGGGLHFLWSAELVCLCGGLGGVVLWVTSLSGWIRVEQ